MCFEVGTFCGGAHRLLGWGGRELRAAAQLTFLCKTHDVLGASLGHHFPVNVCGRWLHLLFLPPPPNPWKVAMQLDILMGVLVWSYGINFSKVLPPWYATVSNSHSLL